MPTPMPTPTARPSPAFLTPEEWDLVGNLRQLSPGPLRDGITCLVAELVAFVAHPTCADAQADGSPCLSTHLSCEQCQQVASVVASLRRRVRRA
jgi:hypothetical protein